jgi:4-hydroxy-3-polyprenylbenzoate decarboxylase
MNLQKCVLDLERADHLIRITQEVDANLEAAEIQRRVYEAGGPAILFERVKGCSFPMVSNLFGTSERVHYMFRHTLEAVRRLVELKIDPTQFAKKPLRYAKSPFTALHMLPKYARSGPAIACQTTVDQLPQLKSWPDDAGEFITLPEVYTEDVTKPGLKNSNLGMYRIQLSGNEYQTNQQVGLHYQIHRSIGVHHAKAIEQNEPFKVNVFVGGSPAMILSAVMPLPEGMSELMFAGALDGARIKMIKRKDALPIYSQADFCICGTVDPKKLLPEGPFGDHLGYYSLAHDFPVLNVDRVYHRQGAIWPFTVVGRPPQEDTLFGEIIHEITGPIIPTVLPGVDSIHAVDASGVHPLLLAVGSERYTPFSDPARPQELLTQANAILGQGQLSLAKYLIISNRRDAPDLDIHHIDKFFTHVLERVDWRRDLHFQTSSTIDTLDYSGSGLNQGSKVVIAAAGPAVRQLPTQLSPGWQLPHGLTQARVCGPGILAVESTLEFAAAPVQSVLGKIAADHPLNEFPLVVLVDDAQFVAEKFTNFLWATFTRSNPSADIAGVGEFIHDKHWGCTGSLVIDARVKPHHAPPLVEDPAITERVNQLATAGGPLHNVI